jgi:signal transduction histidine kinase
MEKMLVVRNVTRIEKLEEMNKRAEQHTAMGDLAANIAYEIRNPLGSIELFASLIMKEGRDEKVRDRASQIIRSVRNVDAAISNLLLFARELNPVMKRVNLLNVLREVVAFTQDIIEKDSFVYTVSYADENLCVAGDAELLKQVFLNLILNAYQAMPAGGHLHIETKMTERRDKGGKHRQSYAHVSFVDTGVGIPPESIQRIFDPFFTTREKGAGIGLAIVHNIVRIHGGTIDVENGKTGGTVFHVTVPLIKEYDPELNRNI